MYLIFKKKSADSKTIAFSFLSNVFTEYEDEQLLRLELFFHGFIKNLTKDYPLEELDEVQLKKLVDLIIEFAGLDRIRAFYPAYKNIKFLNGLVTDLTEKLNESFQSTNNIVSALDQHVGNDTIPVMTVHKSKG